MAGAMDESVLAKPRSSSKQRIGFFISLKTKLGPLRIGVFSFFFLASVNAFPGAVSGLALGDVLLEVFRLLALDDAASLSIAAPVSSTFVKSSWRIALGAVPSSLFLTCATMHPHSEGSNRSLSSPK